MLCEKCQKREANVMVTEIKNGKHRQMHLCSQCATGLNSKFAEELSLGKLLSGLLGIHLQTEEPDDPQTAQVTCPECGMTYGEFIKESRFGCADCYDTFGVMIEDNLKRIQASSRHTGKRPKYQQSGVAFEEVVETVQQEEDLEERLELLQAKLMDALSEEDYESAAVLRDEIRAVKGQLGAL